jgi:predicted kinase
MQAVILMGLQGSGKSSLFDQQFRYSHVLISLDVLNTRHREQRFLQVCLQTQQRLVIDNTNPSVADRARYIPAAKAAGFRVIGYYFAVSVADCLLHNRSRPPARQVPDVAIKDAARRWQMPSFAEGFDELYEVIWQDQHLSIRQIHHEPI